MLFSLRQRSVEIHANWEDVLSSPTASGAQTRHVKAWLAAFIASDYRSIMKFFHLYKSTVHKI
jgi:hypothetical protein